MKSGSTPIMILAKEVMKPANSRSLSRRALLGHGAWAAAVLATCHDWVRGAEPEESVRCRLVEPLARGGNCCLAWLNPEHGFIPTGGYEMAHDSGRWWDAMLRLEAATGFSIPEKLERAMLGNLRRMTGNPDGLLINDGSLDDIPGGRPIINPHNFREGIGAFTALVIFRNSDWACRAGRRLLETLDRIFQADGRLDYERLECWGKIPLSTDPSHAQPAGTAWFDGTATSGRALESVLRFYQATNDPLAMEVAERIARHHLAKTVNLDGSVREEIIDPSNVGHNHSYLGTLRGLLLYGLWTQERKYVDAVTATYEKTLWEHNVSESGWSPHDLGKTRFPNPQGEPVGEHASCADVVQLALWLALKEGRTEFLDDTERLIRARLLPSQITDHSDSRRYGAWGAYSHPFGQGSIIDVIAHVVHALADVQEHIVTCSTNGAVSVNLHFDAETPLVSVSATRGKTGRLQVVAKQSRHLRLRVPGWAPRDTLRLWVAGKRLPPDFEGDYLTISAGDLPAGANVELEYDLPGRETVEVMPVTRREFRLTWRGDQVMSCDPKVPIY